MEIIDPRAVLFLATWLPSELHASFSDWCDDHHREQLALPGFRRARRFEWLSSGRDDDPPQFLTMYDLDSLDVLTSPEYLEHARTASVLPEFLHGHLRVQRRDCSVIASLPSPWWPPTSTPLLDLFQLTDDALAIGLRQQVDAHAGPIDANFRLRLIDSAEDEPLVLIDHEESAAEAIDRLTRASGALRSTWRCRFDEQPGC